MELTDVLSSVVALVAATAIAVLTPIMKKAVANLHRKLGVEASEAEFRHVEQLVRAAVHYAEGKALQQLKTTAEKPASKEKLGTARTFYGLHSGEHKLPVVPEDRLTELIEAMLDAERSKMADKE